MTATFLRSAPIVATFHSAGRNVSYEAFPSIVRSWAERLDLRVAVSKDAVLLAERYLGGTYDMLFNGVDLEEYTPGDGARETTPTVLFCGRHEERKGLGVLLEAMQLLPPDVRCWIAGSGPETERLRKAYAKDQRIEWLGQLSDAEKISRLQRANAFCAPSLHGESFGIVLIEAMATGAPVVASALDGYRNVATHGDDALLVDPGDAIALADALRQALTDGDASARRSAAGLRRAAELSMERLASEYVKRYEQVVDGAAERSRSIERQGPGPFARLGRMIRR